MDSNQPSTVTDQLIVDRLRELFMLFAVPDWDEGGQEIPPDEELLHSYLVTLMSLSSCDDHFQWLSHTVLPTLKKYSNKEDYPDTLRVYLKLGMIVEPK